MRGNDSTKFFRRWSTIDKKLMIIKNPFLLFRGAIARFFHVLDYPVGALLLLLFSLPNLF